MRNQKLGIWALLLLPGFLAAQQTKVDPARLLRHSATATSVLTTNGAGATEWVGSAAWLSSLNVLTGTVGAGQVAYGTGSGVTGGNNLFWDATNNNLGVGLSTPPNYRLHVKSYGNDWEGSAGALGVFNLAGTALFDITNDGRASIGPRTNDASMLSVKVPDSYPSWWKPIGIASPIGNLSIYANTIFSSATSFAFGSSTFGSAFGFESPTDNYLFWMKANRLGFGGSIFGANNPLYKYHFSGDTYNGEFFHLQPGLLASNDRIIDIAPANNLTGDVYTMRSQVSATGWHWATIKNTNTSSPTAHTKLTLSTGGTSAGDPIIELGVTGGNFFYLGVDNADNDMLKILANDGDLSGAGIFNIKTSGEFGLNTNAPTATLDVNGSARFRAAIHDANNSAGSNGNVLVSTGSATQWTASGGDVSGGYSNLQLGSAVVGQPELAANSVTASKVVDGEITTADLANGAVDGFKIAQMAATDNQALTWDNAQGKWVPETISGGGGAPTDAEYLVINTANATLTNERVLTNGANVQVTDDGAGGYFTVSAMSGVLSPAQITANQNDYNPTNWGTNSFVLIFSDQARTITGLSALATGVTRFVKNTGQFPILFSEENTSSSASNRISGGGMLAPGKTLHIVYDGSRWNVINNSTSLADDAELYYTISVGSTTAGDHAFLASTTSGGAFGTTGPTSSLPAAWTTTTGTTSTGSAIVYFPKTVTSLAQSGNSQTELQTVVSVPTLSTSSERFVAGSWILAATTAAAEPTNNAVGIYYQDNVSGGNWTGLAIDNAGGATNVDLGVTVTANTVYFLKTVLEQNGTRVSFYINNVYKGSATANMPSTTTNLGVKSGIVKKVGTTSRTLNVHKKTAGAY